MLVKEYDGVLLEKEDAVGYIILNKPENMNPVTAETVQYLSDALLICEMDPEIRCIVLRGAGGNFSAGGNVKAMKERLDKGINTSREGIRAGAQFTTRLRYCCKPTIAWMEGAVAGAGISMAMACDFSIAAEDCKMTFAFVNIGYVPDNGITHMLIKSIGRTRATDLLMSGKRFTGKDAADWGIVTAAFPKEELEENVRKYIKKYSNGPSVAYTEIKKLINEASMRELNACMQEEVFAQYTCSQTADHYEAITAFVEKRKPVFQGK